MVLRNKQGYLTPILQIYEDQLEAVYKAGYEHSIEMTKTHSEASLCEDYFTMPFVVLDKSLHTSGKGSKELNLLDGGEAALLSMDATIHNIFFS